MTLEEMRQLKRQMSLTNEQIAESAEIPVPTVQKVLGGTTKSPRMTTVQALERAFLKFMEECDPVPAYSSQVGAFGAHSSQVGAFGARSESGFVRETSGLESYSGGSTARSFDDRFSFLPHKRQGEYTASDREMLPSSIRTELIDGVLYDLASPRTVHQIISTKLLTQIDSQIGACGKTCRVFAAPSDVWLTGDDRNIFQPDLYVICDDGMIGKDGYVVGAPPLIIEILSPSTRAKDMLLKTYKYSQAGVLEYWIVDPQKRKIIVYWFAGDPSDPDREEYSFDDVVTIGISDGHCKVDFGAIKRELQGIWWAEEG